MRTSRLLGDGRCFYHCMSRVVDKQFIFQAEEKQYFRDTMRKLETFLGVRVITYALMSNHFHLLLEVPDREAEPRLTPEKLLSLLPVLYGKNTILDVEQELKRAEGNAEWIQKIVDRYAYRRCDLGYFMKELKQRFTQWYNRKSGRRGTLWEDRYKSVLVEGNENALITMAAYIDLNPVRAGIVTDPKGYQWCGYGEAVAGVGIAQNGLGRLLEEVLSCELFQAGWERTSTRYRQILYEHGEERNTEEESPEKPRRGFSREKVKQVLGEGGKLSKREILNCKVRYFCDGAVFGSARFVNEFFESNRDRFGPKRKSGARKMQGADWGSLRVLRDLRNEVIEI